MKRIADIQEKDPTGLIWGVAVEIQVLSDQGPTGSYDVAKSFSDAWIPRFSAMLHFAMPFTDADLINITEGQPDNSILLKR